MEKHTKGKGHKKLLEIYGGKIRLRVCGVLENEGKVLMINHQFLNKDNVFWNFPGGGLLENELIADCLKREFLEETNLEIEAGKFLYFNQHLVGEFHAVELYFAVKSQNMNYRLGSDPEFNILSDLRWFKQNELEYLPESHKPWFVSEIFKKLR